MARYPYTEVDVFTDRPMLGNALAVVHDADALDAGAMQAFARWTGLSETTFLLAPGEPGADYRVHIYTPGGELPFAGHPTLGSCHAWLARGGVPRRAGEVMQQCGVGLVRIRLDGANAAGAAFAAPPLQSAAVEPALLQRIVAALGVAPARVVASRVLDNGPTWIALLLDSAASVLALEPDHAALRGLPKVGVVGPQGDGSDTAFEVRAFAASIGVPEDPVTGSLNASLAEWLIGAGLAPRRYIAAQGQRLGRRGRVHLEHDGSTLWVGGSSVVCVRGEVEL